MRASIPFTRDRSARDSRARPDRAREPGASLAQSQLLAVLDYARERDYVGWDLYDGESSRFLQALPGEHKWLNLLFQQTVRRAPLNLRPLLGVEQRRSFMGAALFALANFTAFDLTGEPRYRADGIDLADWLLEEDREGYGGYCGGHNHPVQGLDHRTPVSVPGIVGTAQAVRALLAAGDHAEGPYRETARTAARFVVDDLEYERVPDGARIKYKPDDAGDTYTINANALGARLFVDLYAAFGEPTFRERAGHILDWVVAHQSAAGGWYYRAEPDGSHLSMDTFHNAFILESLLRYRTICESDRFDAAIANAVAFFRDRFDEDGAPHWDEQSRYPRDVHASAQGIVVFSLLDEPRTARRILEWTVSTLSDGRGRFYHEQRRFYTKRITLMRWCQAWMAYALATYLRHTRDVPSEHFVPRGVR